MTLVASWIRVTPGGEELVVASDSRLTGGLLLNHAPKLFRLERQDAVIAYCGLTIIAYPILLQIKASLDGHEETRSRVLDIVHLKSHIEKVIESLRSKVADLPSEDGTNRAFKFLLAGYSWKTSAFRMWTFRYDVSTGDFNAHSARKSGNFLFMSDRAENEKRALDALSRSIERNPKGSLKKLNWEPLNVLVNVIRDPTISDVGGPPQLIKVYKHANTLPINVIWPADEPSEELLGVRRFEVTHLGRPLLGYERSRYLAIDPDTCELLEPWSVGARLEDIHERERETLKRRLQSSLCLTISALRDKRGRITVANRLLREGVNSPLMLSALDRTRNTPFSAWYSE